MIARLVAGVGLLVAALTLVTAPAQAEVSPPPNPSAIDERGIDQLTGQAILSVTDVAIGPNDRHGLKFTRQIVGDGWRIANIPTISGDTTNPTVSFGGQSAPFKKVGTVYVPVFPDGSSLTLGTSSSTFTSSDGTVIEFGSFSQYFMVKKINGYASLGTKVTYPDGTVWNYTYNSGSYLDGGFTYQETRLSSITSSTGYQIKLSYYTDTLTTSSYLNWEWNRIVKATALNNAVEYCDPASCTPSSQWASATYPSAAQANANSGIWWLPDNVTDPEGRRTDYTYALSTTGYPLKTARVHSESQDSLTLTYNAAWKVASATVHGDTWNYTYNTNSTVVTDELSRTKTTNFNAVGQTISKVAGGLTSTFDYCTASDTSCPEGLLKTATMPEGNGVRYSYDTRGNVTATIRVPKPGSGLANIITSAAYPASCTNQKTCNRPTSTTDAKGNVTDYTYDSSTGAVTSIKLPAAASGGTRPETRISYSATYARYKNSAGALVQAATSISLPTGISKCRTSASPGCVGTTDEQVTVIAYPSGTTASNAQPISTTTKLGNNTLAATTAVTYNNFGEALTVDGPLSGTADTTRIRYSTFGELIGKVSPDPDGSGAAKLPATKYNYNSRGQVSVAQTGTVNGLTDTDWNNFAETKAVTTEYDDYGRPKRQRVGTTGAGGTDYQVSDILYDSIGRVSCTIQRMDPSNWSSAPTSCLPTQTAGADGADRVSFVVTYDALDRATKITTGYGTGAAVSEETEFTDNGRIAAVTDGDGNLSLNEYDGYDRLSKTYYPEKDKESGVGSGNDYEQVSYDAAGNVLTFRTRRGEIIGLVYDNLNRLMIKDVPTRSGLAATNTRDVYFGYDLFGDLTSATFDSATGEGITNTFNALGQTTVTTNNMDSISLPLSFQYDSAGEITRITFNDSNYFRYDYSGGGALTGIGLNGSASLVGFDLDTGGRISSIKRYNTSSAGWTENSAITYDAFSRPQTLGHDLSSVSRDVITSYTYNPVSQIKSAIRDNDAYAWNGAANIGRNYTANGLNAYDKVGSANFTYDDNGNLTSDGTDSYVYDIENRLVSRSGGASATLRYDPLGRLYEVVSGGSTTRFLYSGDKLVGEYDGSGILLRRYAHGLGAGDDPLVWYEGSGVSDSARRYLYSDERGSIVAVTDSTGAVIPGGINSYDEYGIPGATNAGRFQYTGQVWLPELGMYYYKARMYSPTLGRFMQVDPIGYGDGANMYEYAHGDPINGTDPTGKDYVYDCSWVAPANEIICNGRYVPPEPCGFWGVSCYSMPAFIDTPYTPPPCNAGVCIGGNLNPGGGVPAKDNQKKDGQDPCTQDRKIAGQLAKGFDAIESQLWALDVAAGIGTLVSGIGEIPSGGTDTPLTLSLGGTTVDVGAMAFAAGAASAAFKTYASGGDPTALKAFETSNWNGTAAGELFHMIPGFGKYSKLAEQLTSKASGIALDAENVCH